jgi:hypothetical protein
MEEEEEDLFVFNNTVEKPRAYDFGLLSEATFDNSA